MRKKPRDLSLKGKIAAYITLTFFALFAIYPVLRVFSISIRPGDRLLTKSLSIIPDDFTFTAYYHLIFEEPFLLWMANSLLISVIVTLVGTGLAVTAGYAFSAGFRLGELQKKSGDIYHAVGFIKNHHAA